MKIKKMYQGTAPENKILNTQSDSQTDVYSCNYINNNYKINLVEGEEISTNEFIDGKRIYKRVFRGTMIDVISGNSLILFRLDFDFAQCWIDETNSFIANDIETLGVNWYYTPTDYLRTWVRKAEKQVKVKGDVATTLEGREYQIVLRYTKTTD